MVKKLHNDVTALTEDAFMRLLQLTLVFSGFMQRGMAERGLTPARGGLIWHLHHQGPLTQRALSQALRVTPRNITGLVDALEADGLVVRAPHPNDRRATLITLTTRGQDLAADMAADYRHGAKQLLGGVERAELAGFVATVDGVLARLSTAPE
jgi:DNA-binding MarR family transcriptional regulator